MQLRAPTLADLDALFALDQRCFAPGIAYSKAEIHAALRAPRTFHRAAQDTAGQLAGFILTAWHRDRGHVVTVDVAAAHRRAGLGSQLMQAAEEEYRKSGARGMRLEVAVNNAPALGFYAQRGYRVVRVLPGYYAGDLDGLLLTLDWPAA